MIADPRAPWKPAPREANLLILLLAFLVCVLVGWRLTLEHRAAPPSAERITAEGRVHELLGSARALVSRPIQGLLGPAEPDRTPLSAPWDRTLQAVLAAERGDMDRAETLADESPAPFRRCFEGAYLEGELPSPADRKTVGEALRHGYAARLLEARLVGASDPALARRLRQEAVAWALPRVAVLGAVGFGMLLLVPVGILMSIILLLLRKRPKPFPIPAVPFDGRMLCIVLLGWLTAFLVSGTIAAGLTAWWPPLRPFLLPIAYLFHGGTGFLLLCRAEGVSFRGFLRRRMPAPAGKSLLWGLGFLSIAVALVLVVSMVVNAIARPHEAPQQQLMDMVAGTRGPLAMGTLFVTVAVMAPLFEESLFRGVILPWLGQRLEKGLAPKAAWTTALLLSSLGFGLIHLQPAALPVLSTLGLALGLAFLQTRSLLASMLLHGIWNGGVFLFYRLVLG